MNFNNALRRPPEEDTTVLRPLARQFPTIEAAVAEMARLSAELTLPMGTIHIISDVHGEHGKLRHIINNASGTLRPLVERLFGDQLTPAGMQDFLSLLFYPKETLIRQAARWSDLEEQRSFTHQAIRRLLALLRTLARRYSVRRVESIFPPEYREILREMVHARTADADSPFLTALVDRLVEEGKAPVFLRRMVRVVRNLAIDELIIAGDFWDRGPRGDKVMEYVKHLPNVAITWGNHDAAWLGASLGHEALIAHVLRISLRYQRLEQLEEGYGISLRPLEQLVAEVYADDPAQAFVTKGNSSRRDGLLARMHKAAAILQFKLEGKVIERNPHFDMGHRRLLHHIDFAKKIVQIDGKAYPLRDCLLSTVNPDRPYELAPAEHMCLSRLRESFTTSSTLKEHMRYLVHQGAMYLRRDDNLIFHGCVPVNDRGEFLTLEIDGVAYGGRALFEAIECVVVRALEEPRERDLDLLWYLWCGPCSPLFGKDRITTFENDFVADKSCHVEKKNAYFSLIHNADFCRKILTEFEADPARGLIVNGHVPVKIEEGESPLKESGLAITIDGAFSEAYGDHGYTLVLEADRTHLAKHHHFESVDAAVRDGVDIIPAIMEVRRFKPPRRVGDTEKGRSLKAEIDLLRRLVSGYRTHQVQPHSAGGA